MSNTQEPYFKAITLGHYLNELPKSTLPASEAKDNGHYPFYCSSSVVKYCNTYLQDKPTVLMGTGGVASVNFGNDKFAYSTDTWAFRSNDEDEVKTEYIYRLLQLKLSQIDYRAFEGSGLKHLRKNDVKKLTLRVPVNKHLTEKLLYIFRNIDSAIEKTEALIEKYQQIKAGLMHDLFTRGIGLDGKLRPPREEAPELYQETPIGWIPLDWKYNTLKQIFGSGNIINGPFGSDLLTSELKNEGTPVLYCQDIKVGAFTRISKSHVSEYKALQLAFCNVRKNDILLAKVGSPPCDSCVYDDDVKAIVTQDVIRIRPSNEHCAEYFSSWFNSSYGRKSIKKISIEGTRERVSLGEFKNLLLPLPDILEQNAIGQRLNKSQRLISLEKENLLKLNKQKSGLMHDLLTGKVQVPINTVEEAHV